jgi:hypothetical protein
MLLSKNCESSRLSVIAQPIWDLSAPHWPISLLGTWLADWANRPLVHLALFFCSFKSICMVLIQINLHGDLLILSYALIKQTPSYLSRHASVQLGNVLLHRIKIH